MDAASFESSVEPRPAVTLRAIQVADLPVLHAHQCDPTALRMAVFRSRDLPAFTAHWETLLRDPRFVTRAVLADATLAGYVSSYVQGERRLVGYWIGREHWGRGVATRALGAFLVERSEPPLWAYVARSNRASIRVLEKNGFEFVVAATTDEDPPVEEWLFRLDGPRRAEAHQDP